jgi:Cu/Ag efflux protein CusF
MNRYAFLVFCATVSFPAFSVRAHEGHLPQVDGVIRKLDHASSTVTITHSEIPNLNMGAMTMSFKAKTPSLLKPWKEGDKIRFRAADTKGMLTVYTIEAAK